jgi:hypothetical protein
MTTCLLSMLMSHSLFWWFLVFGSIGMGLVVLLGVGYLLGAERYCDRM